MMIANRMMLATWPRIERVGLIVFLVCASGAPTSGQPKRDARSLWEELRRRGMSELLDHALSHADEADWVEAQLFRREMLLETYHDPDQPSDAKLAALEAAVQVLDDLVGRRPGDPRAIEWRRTLGWELIYRRAEPYYMNILLKTPTDDDRRQLLALATQAESVFEALGRSVQTEKEGIEQLGDAAFEQAIDRLQTLNVVGLEGEYFMRWARFYRALAMDAADPKRDALLGDVLTFLVETGGYTDRPHDETGVQCEALVLAGMASRLLRRSEDADRFLTRAIDVADGIEDADARNRVQWVVVLARLETIKLARDLGRPHAVDTAVQRFHDWMAATPSTTFGTRLAIALLEMDIYRRRAETARSRHDETAYSRWMMRSRRPLLDLARTNPAYQDAIYQTVYPLLGEVDDLSTLDAFEKNVYMAGLMAEATTLQHQIEAFNREHRNTFTAQISQTVERLRNEMADKLDRAVRVADRLLADNDALARELRAETLFNRAACLYHRGNHLEATRTFATVADEHPRFERAETAAGHAVEIAAQLYQDPTLGQQSAVRETYLRALQVITARYPDSEKARYSRFFLANVLERIGRYDEAAVEYARVRPDHPRFIDAQYSRLLCLQRKLDDVAAEDPNATESLRAQARDLADQAEAFAQQAFDQARRVAASPGAGPTADEVTFFAGDAEIIAATVRCGDLLREYRRALDILDDFSTRFAGRRDLLGAALRVRILAHQGLRQFDEATRVVDTFLRDQPEYAGPVIESLLVALREDVNRARDRGERAAADARAQELLGLADRLWTWAQQRGPTLDAEQRLNLNAMRADAYLLSGDFERALAVFSECVDADAARQEDGRARHGASLFGKAEALRQLGRYADAIVLYNDVWQRSEPRSPLWWQALAGSLDCHTHIGTSPRTILNSITQHRDSHMGGPRLRAEFDRLENINRRRQQSGGP